MASEGKKVDKKRVFKINHGDDSSDDVLFDKDIIRLNLAQKVIDKLNIQAAECAFMGVLDDDDKPIELDDINLDVSSSLVQ